MKRDASKTARNGAAPLPRELLQRAIAARDAGETFGVSKSTLARALAGFEVMPLTARAIEAVLAGASVPRGTNEDGGAT